MEGVKRYRSYVFQEIGKKRIHRILICSFFIAVIWCFADLLSGNLSFNILHDLICLGLGIIAERVIPWGKSENNS